MRRLSLLLALCAFLVSGAALAQFGGMFPGPGTVHSAGGSAPTLTQLAAPASQSVVAATSMTFTSQPLGTSGAGRLLVVAVGGSPQGATLSSVTAGGNAMTRAAGADEFQSLYYVASPGGTGSIVLNFNATSPEFAILISELTGVTATPTSTADAALSFQGPTYAPANLTPITVPSTGFAILVSTYQVAGGTPTFNNITKDPASATSVTTQALGVQTANTQTTGNVSFTSYTGFIGYAVATWGP